MRLPFPRSSPPPPLARSPRVGAFGWIPAAATATATAAATALLLFVRAGTASGLSPHQAAASYAEARRVRALEGPSAAVALYRSLLDRYPGDATAAARIAADPYQASKHDRLGRGGSPRERREATRFLQESFGFERESVAGLVFAGPVPGNGNGNGDSNNDDDGNGKCGHESQGPTLDHRLFRALRSSAPLYLKARGAGTVVPPLPATPLEACVQLFLMGVSLPTETCKELLGRRFVELAETLGLAFTTGGGGAEAGAEASGERAPDPAGSWFVPYAHVFPVSIGDKTLYLATDLHPTVLSSTTVGGSGSTPGGSGGSTEDGAVMYIGPDSL
ncbi:unnamed protein product [Pseudo-nitzschia multistriata]|uniref:Uncharacterized protein n=1 Tax=Pseudo-nitzschia multistriata TaxID=183589 RepID=A0A448Z151_9STRA|nr:unnamed protein product [Pseudo-nitzschia multistriata]